MQKIILSIPDAPTSEGTGLGAGSGIVVFLVSTAVLGAIGYSVYDYFEHGHQWFWHRFNDENRLLENEGMPKKDIIQQIVGLFDNPVDGW
jgi:hypothetical protein